MNFSISLPSRLAQTVLGRFSSPRIQPEAGHPQAAAEEARYAAYALAEQARLDQHLQHASTTPPQAELLRSFSMLLWSYRSTVRVGMLSSDQAIRQYSLRLSTMARDFNELRLPDPSEQYYPAAAVFQAVPAPVAAA